MSGDIGDEMVQAQTCLYASFSKVCGSRRGIWKKGAAYTDTANAPKLAVKKNS